MKKTLIIPVLLLSATSFAQGKFFGGNGDGFSSASIINAVLPLQVINFSGFATGNANIVYWTTRQGTANLYFAIERSTDAVQYKKIGQVAGNGNNGPGQYRFADSQLNASLYYYRLKQVDAGRQIFYSAIIRLQHYNGIAAGFRVSPNPVINRAVILTGDAVTAPESFLLVNGNGMAVEQFNFTGNSKSLDLSGRAAGLYYLVRLKTGQAIKLVKSMQ